MDDRRSNGRTRTSKAASIVFGGQTGEHSCDVEVTDLADGGAGIHKPGLALLPLTFELSFDSLRRKCRMVWRNGNFFGVTFDDQISPAHNETEIEKADAGSEEPALSLFDQPEFAAPLNDETLTEFASKIAERDSNGRSDARFAVGVALALALPALISLGAYVAMTVVLRAG